MKKTQENLVKNILGIVLFLISAGAFFLMLFMTTTSDIWYDEVFSVGFMSRSFKDIVALTARDVHPPLYYFYLKVMVGILGVLPGISVITAAKIASLLPWVVLFVLAVTYIRKNYGLFVSGLFALMISVMPQLGTYYLEIRMYSFGLMLITGAFLVSLEIIKKPNNVKWGLFFVLGAATAYTQYYACVAIVGLYIVLGIYLVMDKRYKDTLTLGIMALLSGIAYIPWLPSLYRQMTTISGNYWIQPLTIRSIFGCIKFITLPVFPYSKLPYVSVGLLLLMILIAGFIWIMKIRPSKQDAYEVLGGFGIIFVVILSGFVLSAMGTPIFTYRYMIPCLGALYLGLAILLDKVTVKKWLLVLIVPILFSGYLSMRGLYDEEHKKVEYTPEALEALKAIPDGSIIITNFDHVTSLMSYYMPDNDIYLYEAETDRLIPDMFSNCKGAILRDEIGDLVRKGNNVYFFGSFNSREEILEDWKKLGVEGVEEGSYLLERYWFNIYRLSEKE